VRSDVDLVGASGRPQTTDHRRPTTDDRRPTTDDRRGDER
jgi:hypothetical protein